MSTDAPDSRKPYFRKPKYTDQDIRTQVIEMRDELIANVDFLIECIREDRYKLQRYKEKFGDLKYRPLISPGKPEHAIEPVYGNPTDVNLEPLASTYRASINSLLQSIRLIQSEIMPADNPEGTEGARIGKEQDESDTKRASLRESFTTAKSGKALEPTNDTDTDDEPTELVEAKPRTPISASKPTTKPNPTEGTDSNPRPWRAKPTTFVSKPAAIPTGTSPIVAEETKKNPPKSLTNPNQLDAASERLKAELNNLKAGSSRIGSLRDKYKKRDDDDGDDEEG